MAVQRILTLVSGVMTMLVPNQTSAGAGDAGKIPALNSAGTIDITMMPSGVAADVCTATATATLTAGQLVNVYNNAGTLSVRPADNTNPASFANGYVLSGISNAASGTVYLGPGVITGLSGLTLGSSYFLGTVGAVTTTAPSSAGTIVQPVGIALSTSSFEFNPSPTPVTVA